MNILEEENDDLYFGSSFISNCCGAPPWGELYDAIGNIPLTGICSRCKDHASFSQEIEEE